MRGKAHINVCVRVCVRARTESLLARGTRANAMRLLLWRAGSQTAEYPGGRPGVLGHADVHPDDLPAGQPLAPGLCILLAIVWPAKSLG